MISSNFAARVPDRIGAGGAGEVGMAPVCSWQVRMDGLNQGILATNSIYPPLDHWIWLIPAFLIGACIGSFLNVVIYRLPLGMSVNEPKRSFCPGCKKAIPMWLNLPLLSWLWLRGKCRECGSRIAFRYFGVELLTAGFFAAIWWVFAPQAVAVVLFLWVLAALLIAITFIDAEHLIIPTSLTWAGSLVGVVASAVWPQLPDLSGEAGDWMSGVKWSVIGWASGFAGLWLVVELGKKMFGKKAMHFPSPVAWSLKEPENDVDPMCFVIDGESIAWWDIFSRKSDRLMVEAASIRIDGKSVGKGGLIIREREIELSDGTVHTLENMKSLDGTATAVVIPREAMGMGDVHLLAMIGAFFGVAGVLVSVMTSCVLALLAALLGRVGFGRVLPYGPFLAMGAVGWMFGTWKLWEWYLQTLTPYGLP
jgi:leader peptidase (prepilin peptidase)/N-methyltransferase